MTPPTDTTTTSTRKQRRTSIVDLPSRLLGRMINSTDTWSLPDKADRVRRSEDNAAHSSTRLARPTYS
jgi:hypothetical protein